MSSLFELCPALKKKKDVSGRSSAPSRTNQSLSPWKNTAGTCSRFAIWPCLEVGLRLSPLFPSFNLEINFLFFYAEGAGTLLPFGPNPSIHHWNVLYWSRKDLAMLLVLINKKQVHNTVFNCRNGDLNSPGSVCASIQQVFITFLPDNIEWVYSQGFCTSVESIYRSYYKLFKSCITRLTLNVRWCCYYYYYCSAPAGTLNVTDKLKLNGDLKVGKWRLWSSLWALLSALQWEKTI